MKRLLLPLASLRLTVALFACAMLLIFVGTLAQVRMGVWEAVSHYFRAPVAWGDPGVFVPGAETPGWLRLPIPGGLTIGVLMIINLLAAHAVRFRLVPGRVGIILLHAGIIILLVGEFATGAFSREGLMRIDEGGSSSFVEDLRSVEMAIIDPGAADFDTVVSVPGRLLSESAREGRPIRHESLPFDITVEQWMPNARLFRAHGHSMADRGVGREAFAEEVPRVSGVDAGGADAPAAYVTLSQGGERLGTWLLWANLIEAQPVPVGDEAVGVSLRFARTYKPYRLELLEFRHDKYVGTEVARNFSSRVRLVDERSGTDREAVIWMNNPLRHAGETFYQASYKPDGSGTVLQVVRNPAAPLPYIASALVGGGMAWHFVLLLVRYLRRERAAAGKDHAGEDHKGVDALSPRRRFGRIVYPALAGMLGLALACQGVIPRPAQQDFDLDGFGLIPVTAGGRIKPMDTAARHLASITSGRQAFRFDGERVSATRFLLDLVAQPDDVRDQPVLRVDHPGVLALLGLDPGDAGRISLAAVEPHWDSVGAQAMRAASVSGARRDAFQRAVLSLHSRVNELLAHAAMEQPHGIPPLGPGGEWQPFSEAFVASHHDAGAAHPAVSYHVAMMTAWNDGDPLRFNRAVEGYLALLERDMGGVMDRMRLEVLFNRAQPFVGAMVLYTVVFLLVCGGLLLRARGAGTGLFSAENLRRGAVGLLWAAVIIHTAAILVRVFLQGRPPVTNLYSSAVFVGWAAVVLGLVLEHVHRLGVAALGASAVGFSTLVVAHNLGTDGDTMEMMQAVLDSNFWLATHVITITLGYSATFLAGALAIVYLVLGAFTRLLSAGRSRALARMVYGTVCFALLLSFVGTVLGGIWADQSWGRFWGWDPKENGAALVVLLNAIILHARWGGLVRERGIMVLAVAGNIVTAWSWFGTNMLGVGLHSYGFMESATSWMVAFVASQLLVMGLGFFHPGRRPVADRGAA